MILCMTYGKPLNSKFECKEAKKELIFFRGLLANSTSGTFVDSFVKYFNMSEIYIKPIEKAMRTKLKCKI